MWGEYRELWIAFFLVVVSIAALAAIGQRGWPGNPDECLVGDQCFCERDRGGLIRQPANTLSNLGFVFAGLAIAAHLGRARRRRTPPLRRNPMTETRLYPGIYACLVALLGPGSMALHASLRDWGGVLDIVSMNIYVSFLFMYGLLRWRRISAAQFVAGYLALNVLLLAIKLTYGHGSEAFGVVAALALWVELNIRRSGRMQADLRWLLAGAGSFLLAFAIWLPSRNGGFLCNPDSLLQGHAVWHLLSAAATLALYAYARSENDSGNELMRARSHRSH